VGAGIFLTVLGALLTFAVRADLPGIDLQSAGVILMIAGVVVIVHHRRGSRHERVVTRVEETPDPTAPPHTVEHTIVDKDADV
jgi:membrane protein implicated in regulation of membrane protease activity